MTTNAPAISVILCCRNAESTLTRQLDAIAAQRCDAGWELVIVDNNSTDDTTAIARRFAASHDWAIVVDERQTGINHARNAGASAAGGTLLLFCDADDVVHPGWIAAHVRASPTWDLAGGALEVQSLNTSSQRRYNPAPPAHQLPTGLNHLAYPIGANLAVHRHIWADVGGFNPDYRRGATEIEFAWRAQGAGHHLGYVPDAVVAYQFRSNRRSALRQARTWGTADVRLQRQFQLPATSTLCRSSGPNGPSTTDTPHVVLWSAAYLTGVLHGHLRRH